MGLPQPQQKQRTLTVRIADSSEKEAFLSSLRKEGLKVWRQAHPDAKKKLGRRSPYYEQIDNILTERWKKSPRKKVTQGQLIRWVEEAFDKKDIPHEDTIRTCVRRWVARNLTFDEIPDRMIPQRLVAAFRRDTLRIAAALSDNREAFLRWAQGLPNGKKWLQLQKTDYEHPEFARPLHEAFELRNLSWPEQRTVLSQMERNGTSPQTMRELRAVLKSPYEELHDLLLEMESNGEDPDKMRKIIEFYSPL